VADLLATLFVHPANAKNIGDARAHVDPDAEVFDRPKNRPGRDWARSAILFGPPGTSKTSLVSAIAAAVRWPLIEVHASHFLQDGLDRIPARADWIFARLMELDRCVVLFDELDELLRDRTEGSDPFGRFLTTLMLPKLTELWKQRRIIYFLNTNLISNADDAIRRSERFDANILVETPSLRVKNAQLGTYQIEWSRLSEEERSLLGLMRFDQIATLKHHLVANTPLSTALNKMFPRSAVFIPQLAQMRREAQRDYRAERVVLLRWPTMVESFPVTIQTPGVDLTYVAGTATMSYER